jgi:hypothetical protein
VLQRVGDPDDQVTARESELARTIYALRDRGLVITPRFDGKWRAEITDTGRFYLKHGYHPDRPSPQSQVSTSTRAAGNQPAQPKSASSQEAEAKKLILLLQQRDGRLRIDDPDEPTRAAWRRAIHAAKQYGLIPEGMHLLHHGRDHGELVIELVEGEHPDAKYRTSRPRLDAPQPRSTHPLIEQLRRHPGRLAVSSGSRERALEILGVLVAEWAHRGHQVALEDDAPSVTFIEGKSRFVLEMSEEYEVVEAPLSAEELEKKMTYSWQRVPVVERQVASGRLVLELAHSWEYSGRRRRWADRQRWSLEDKLGDVLAELEGRVQFDEEQRIARAQEKATRQQQWEAAMAQARHRFVEDGRIKALTEQMQAWTEASRVRDYSAAMEAALPDEPASEVVEWIYWARQYADRIDPVLRGVRPPEIPEPAAYELKPYMGRWSPYGPDGS